MITLKRVLTVLETVAPLRAAESWDNVGLLLEPAEKNVVRRILVTNDLTEEVWQEVQSQLPDVIVSYHPPIFRPIKRMVQSDWKSRILLGCARSDVAVYSPHTALDNVVGGINDWLLKGLGDFNTTTSIKPLDVGEVPEAPGCGRRGDLRSPLLLSECVRRMKTHLGVENLLLTRAVGRGDETIRCFVMRSMNRKRKLKLREFFKALKGAMRTSRRTYMIYGLCVVIVVFVGSMLMKDRFQSSPTRILVREPFIPNSPHSHGEFDEIMNEIGKMDPKTFMDESEHSHAGEDLIAKILYKKVRVFCWIMTGPSNHKTKAVHVKATWAKRCNKYVFMSSVEDKELPSIKLNIKEGRDHLWGKTKAAFKYLYDNELNNFDFFMKADDDTYVVLENLRLMLRNVKPTEPVFFGRKFKPFVKQGYMSGGAGYVVSREGLRRIVEKGFGIHKQCRKDEGGAEDVHFGECAEAVGIIAGDSRDSLGRERFHPFPPDSHMRPIDKGNWLWSYNFYPLKTGPECCSDTSIAYHYIAPDWMYILEYFVYHWHPYGVVRDLSTVKKLLKLNIHEHGFQVQADASGDSDKLAEERQKVEKMREEALEMQQKAKEEMEKAKQEMKKAEELGAQVLKMKTEQKKEVAKKQS